MSVPASEVKACSTCGVLFSETETDVCPVCAVVTITSRATGKAWADAQRDVFERLEGVRRPDWPEEVP